MSITHDKIKIKMGQCNRHDYKEIKFDFYAKPDIKILPLPFFHGFLMSKQIHSSFCDCFAKQPQKHDLIVSEYIILRQHSK